MRRALALWASWLMLGGVVQAPAWAVAAGTADWQAAPGGLRGSLLHAAQALEEQGAPDEVGEELRTLSAWVPDARDPRDGPRGLAPGTQSGDVRRLLGDLFGDGCDAPPAHPALKGLRVPRPPIEIRGNPDFHPGNGVIGGNGTPEDPFVIALWDIRPWPRPVQNVISAGVGILIEGTDAHVRVEHVSLRAELALGDAHPALKAVSQLAGSVGAFNAGIVIRDAKNVVVQGVQVNRVGVGIAFEGVVDAAVRCSVVDKAGSGVGGALRGGRLHVERNVISNSTRDGVGVLVALAGSASASLRFHGNAVRTNGGAGLRLAAGLAESSAVGLALSRNLVERNGAGGVELPVNVAGGASAVLRLEDNVVRNNRGAGIELAATFSQDSQGNLTVSRNTVASNDFDGLGLSVSGLEESSAALSVEENVVRFNGEAGIDLDAKFSRDSAGGLAISRNTVEGNVDGVELSVDVRERASAPLRVHGNEIRDNGVEETDFGVAATGSGIELLSGFGGDVSLGDNLLEGNGYGVTIRGSYGNASLTLERNAIRNSTAYGIDLFARFDGGRVSLADNVVEGNGIEARVSGIHVFGDFGAATMRVERNVLRSNGDRGLRLGGSFAGGGGIAIEGNVAEANKIHGLEVFPTTLPPAALRISGNQASRNGFAGVAAAAPSVGGAELFIESNVAKSNNLTGIQLFGNLEPGSAAWIRGNTVAANGFREPLREVGGGIRVSVWVPIAAGLHISNNLVEGNKRGVAVFGETRALIEGNDILGNEIGIHNVNSFPSPIQPVAHRNNIVGNTVWGYKHESTALVDAESNWWGSASGPGGAGPGTGNRVSANVDFDPWLAAAVGALP